MSLKLSFWIRPSQKTTEKKTPVYLRIQCNSTRTEYSAGVSVLPNEWDKSKQRLKGRLEVTEAINGKLSAIQTRTYTIYNELLISGEPFNSFTVKDRLMNGMTKAMTFNELMDEFIEKMKTLQGKTYAPPTIMKYKNTRLRVSEYVMKRYKQNQVFLYDLNFDFIDGFETFLKSEYNHSNTTVAKHFQRISRIVKIAINKGYINRYPFGEYKCKIEKAPICYLTYEEVKKIEAKKLDITRLIIVKKVFLLSCYSGLSFKELENLRPENIISSDGEVFWISMTRQKTKRPYKVVLLPQAIDLIKELQQYKSYIKQGKLLPILSNQKYNAYLKELADICGIPKRLTSHMGRKTFSIGIALRTSVSIELLSALLGHSNIRVTTDYYAKVTDEMMIDGVKNLAKKLKKII